MKYITSQPWPFPASLMMGCTGEAQNSTIHIDQDELDDVIWMSKEAVFRALNGLDESIFIDSLKSLINSDSLWKPHALLLLGDYFFSKKELSKSKDFYSQILQLENLPNNLYNHSQSQLIIIENE